jgi:uncharacterized protein YjbI with pentapeptide repeats
MIDVGKRFYSRIWKGFDIDCDLTRVPRDLVWSLWCVVCEEVREEWRVFSQARNTRLKRNPHLRTRLTQNQIDQLKQQRRKISDGSQAIALLRDADASDLDLSRFAWIDEDFTNCDLRGANLSGCNFTGANFEQAELWNADLSDSDLTGVTTLLPKQLAATNLKRAKLPDPLSKFEPLEASAKLADNASKVFLTMLSAVAFTFLTLATTKDWQLITNSGNNKLPVIGSDIAIRDFYWAIPVVLLALFIYFHLYLQRLWEALATLPAMFPDGRRLDERSHPWLLTDIVRRSFPRSSVKPPALSRLQSVISVGLGYFVVPITLAFIWWRLLPLRDGRIIGFQLAMLAVGVGFAFCFLGNLRKTLQAETLKVFPIGRLVRSLTMGQGIPAGVAVFLVGVSFSVALFPRVHANLQREDLHEKILRGTNFQDANIQHAYLEAVNLENAHCERAHFEDSEIKKAHLEYSHLAGAHFERADLGDAHLEGAHLEGAHLENARLVNTSLVNAHLEGAHLENARLEGAHLENARLRRADLRHAKFIGANLQDADLEGAVVSDLADLGGVKGIFKGKVIVLPKDDELLADGISKRRSDWREALYPHRDGR